MKKIILLTLLMAGFTFTSCKKCQECTTTTVQTYNGIDQQAIASQDYCGSDYDNAPAEGTTSQSIAGGTQTVTIDCVDK